jgi:hypothetical protein
MQPKDGPDRSVLTARDHFLFLFPRIRQPDFVAIVAPVVRSCSNSTAQTSLSHRRKGAAPIAARLYRSSTMSPPNCRLSSSARVDFARADGKALIFASASIVHQLAPAGLHRRVPPHGLPDDPGSRKSASTRLCARNVLAAETMSPFHTVRVPPTGILQRAGSDDLWQCVHSISNGCDAVSNTRRCISGPTTPHPRTRPRGLRR